LPTRNHELHLSSKRATFGCTSRRRNHEERATRQPASQLASKRWKAFALLVVTYFITIVDFTIVNVALPAIGRELRFPEADLQWLVTAYGLTFAGFLVLGGRAADLLGRRRLLMAGLAVFTAASLAGGLATSDTFR
jgi:predicted MFS family arabinose efflux permease